jgi:hypothetical protein
VEDIANGTVESGLTVQFDAIATTPQILVYSSKRKGTCLWGVFVKDPAKDIGTLIESYGANAQT